MLELTRRGALAAGTAAALTTLAPPASASRSTLWHQGPPLNQYDSDRCTAWAAAAAIVGAAPDQLTIAEGQEIARTLFRRAEELDVYPGRVGATTMQGSAAALVDLGAATSIRWIDDVDGMLAELRRGPVVWASPWVVGMLTPRGDRMQYGSDTMRTSHATLVTGYDPARGIRVRNSWGRSWGGDGSAWLSVADLRKLWAWEPPASFPGPFLPTYCEAYRPVGLARREVSGE